MPWTHASHQCLPHRGNGLVQQALAYLHEGRDAAVLTAEAVEQVLAAGRRTVGPCRRGSREAPIQRAVCWNMRDMTLQMTGWTTRRSSSTWLAVARAVISLQASSHRRCGRLRFWTRL